MAFCPQCGKTLKDGAKFCAGCGASIQAAQPAQSASYTQQPQAQTYAQQPQQQTYTTQQQTGAQPGTGYAAPLVPEAQDAVNNKAMGILAYLGFLVLVPIFAAKESRFARFHANQGLVLAIAEIAYIILTTILNAIFAVISWRLALTMGTILGLLWFGFAAFAIIGIVHAAKGECKKLPLIGGITILK